MLDEKEELSKPQMGAEAEPEAESTEEVIPSAEELKRQLEHKENEIKRLQQLLKTEQKRGVSLETIETLGKRLDEMEEFQATALDYLEELRGVQEPPPERQSHRERLEARKTEQKKEPEYDPEAVKFMAYLDSQDLTLEDGLVREAISEDRSPKEALKYLKGKLETKRADESGKHAAKMAQEIVERKLKELGLTSSGAAGPSAPGSPTVEELDRMTPEQYAAWRKKIK